MIADIHGLLCARLNSSQVLVVLPSVLKPQGLFLNIIGKIRKKGKMLEFTIIGFWNDTLQRFAEHVKASDAGKAEEKCLEMHPGVSICGVIQGSHMCADFKEYITM